MVVADESAGISLEELQLAARNHGTPLESLAFDLTPIGLHYLLIHYDIPAVDPGNWRLDVGGAVRTSLSLSLYDLHARPRLTSPVTFECAGNGRAKLSPRPISQPWLTEAVGTGAWTGTPLRPLLEEAGVEDNAVEVLFSGCDHGVEGGIEQDYERSLSLVDAAADGVLLAYELNGQPLPIQHGFPLRLIVPGWYGMTNVKWLRRITALEAPFNGYQQSRAYRRRIHEGDPGEPVTRMLPRALMVPPGVPEFLSRLRHVRGGPCVITGRAWSGHGPVVTVDVSTDNGATWQAAQLGEPVSIHAWRPWRFEWKPKSPGSYVVACRATDAAGSQQPDEPPWNVGGYANNAVQRVAVTVDQL
jgi:DMSO/TMAO reductase YedYZ molybdopterin-dependent catalytic subunit